ncbi:MAG: hypothetical protein ABSE80_11470 [Halobacteriota archaeon]
MRRESVVVPESELEVLDPSKLGERSEELKAKLLSKIVSQDEAVLACVEHRLACRWDSPKHRRAATTLDRAEATSLNSGRESQILA